MALKGRIGIVADHGGYLLKQEIMQKFSNVEWVDLGTDSDESVDYPDFGYKLADAIESGNVERGIAICGTGIGISMSLNRYKNIRAGVCHNTTTARLTRIDNDANVLCLGARMLGDVLVYDIIEEFFNTSFENGGRHERRVNKLGQKGE